MLCWRRDPVEPSAGNVEGSSLTGAPSIFAQSLTRRFLSRRSAKCRLMREARLDDVCLGQSCQLRPGQAQLSTQHLLVVLTHEAATRREIAPRRVVPHARGAWDTVNVCGPVRGAPLLTQKPRSSQVAIVLQQVIGSAESRPNVDAALLRAVIRLLLRQLADDDRRSSTSKMWSVIASWITEVSPYFSSSRSSRRAVFRPSTPRGHAKRAGVIWCRIAIIEIDVILPSLHRC